MFQGRNTWNHSLHRLFLFSACSDFNNVTSELLKCYKLVKLVTYNHNNKNKMMITKYTSILLESAGYSRNSFSSSIEWVLHILFLFYVKYFNILKQFLYDMTGSERWCFLRITQKWTRKKMFRECIKYPSRT